MKIKLKMIGCKMKTVKFSFTWSSTYIALVGYSWHFQLRVENWQQQNILKAAAARYRGKLNRVFLEAASRDPLDPAVSRKEAATSSSSAVLSDKDIKIIFETSFIFEYYLCDMKQN